MLICCPSAIQEKLSDVRSLVDQLTKERNPLPEVGSGSLKSHTTTRRDDFWTQHRNMPETSVTDHIGSCGHVHALRCFRGAVAPDVLCWSSKCGAVHKDAVDFAFV